MGPATWPPGRRGEGLGGLGGVVGRGEGEAAGCGEESTGCVHGLVLTGAIERDHRPSGGGRYDSSVAGAASTSTGLPRIAITVGDPGGIGPEITAAALSDPEISGLGRYRVIGPGAGERFEARATKVGGELSFRWVEEAIAAAKLPGSDPGHVDAIVTGPISKEAWALAGHGEFPGRTELFGARFGGDAGMMFVSPRLKVILATVHVPLRMVPGLLTRGARGADD